MRKAYFDDTGTLVTESHIDMSEMLVGTAETGVSDSDDHFIWLELLLY